MNKIVNRLLAGDKFMIKLHLRRLGSTYIPCGLFAKDLERIKKFQRNRQFRFLKELLDKACFAHDAAYSDSKDLAKGTISDKTLKDKSLWNCYKS